jgi:hypothetical protein
MLLPTVKAAGGLARLGIGKNPDLPEIVAEAPLEKGPLAVRQSSAAAGLHRCDLLLRTIINSSGPAATSLHPQAGSEGSRCARIRRGFVGSLGRRAHHGVRDSIRLLLIHIAGGVDAQLGLER